MSGSVKSRPSRKIVRTELLKPADHVDRGRQLDERMRPHPRHDHRHARRVALADRIPVGLALLRRAPAHRADRLLRLLVERRIGRAEHELGEAFAQVDEPGAGQVERRARAAPSSGFPARAPRDSPGAAGSSSGTARRESARRAAPSAPRRVPPAVTYSRSAPVKAFAPVTHPNSPSGFPGVRPGLQTACQRRAD